LTVNESYVVFVANRLM